MAVAELFIGDLVFPECPRWHDGRLWFTDIHGDKIWTTDAAGNAELVVDVRPVFDRTASHPSGIGFLPDGSLLIVETAAMALWQSVGGSLLPYAELASYPGQFLNDLVVDDDGRAYAGSRTVPPSATCVVAVEPDGTAAVAADDVLGPNGMAISADGSTFFVAETRRHCITAFDRARNGRLSGRRVFAQLDQDTFPDGICLDRDGAVWTATGLGRSCLRIGPDGAVTDEVTASDGHWILAPVLGGDDGCTLFLATAKTDLEGLESLNKGSKASGDAYFAWARTHSQGWIERIDVTIAGTVNPDDH